MDEKIGNTEYGVFRFVAQSDFDGRPVFLADNAIDGKRDSDPLVFLDPAIIMGIEQSEIRILI